MRIRAQLQNQEGQHRVLLSTDDRTHALTIPSRPTGFGSSANGGELLFLALATCYCNDLYREAAARRIEIRSVEVEVEGEFGGVGEPARHVTYRARVVAANATEADVRRLLEHTDTVAEVQNTLRGGVPVRLDGMDVEIAD